VNVAPNSASGSGFGTAVAGSPVTLQLSGAGTVDFTVTGGPLRVQCENGGWPTSFIATTGSAGTRDADSVLVTVDATAPWYNPAEGTLYVAAEFVTDPADLVTVSTAQFLCIFGDGSSANLVGAVNRNGSLNLMTNVQRTEGGEHVRINSSEPTDPGRHAVAVAWRSSDSAMALDGMLFSPLVNEPFLPPLITGLHIGRSSVLGSVNELHGFIRQVSYWPRRLSDIALLAASSVN
jgi:hypothetical protein